MVKILKNNSYDFKSKEGVPDNFKILSEFPNFNTQCNAENLIFNIRVLEADTFSFPYHYHNFAEELMYIISGSMTLRHKDGFDIVSQGDVLFFGKGKESAHQLYNHTNEECKYFDIRTIYNSDIIEYPDTNKINIAPMMKIFNQEDKINYFEGEENVRNKWTKK